MPIGLFPHRRCSPCALLHVCPPVARTLKAGQRHCVAIAGLEHPVRTSRHRGDGVKVHEQGLEAGSPSMHLTAGSGHQCWGVPTGLPAPVHPPVVLCTVLQVLSNLHCLRERVIQAISVWLLGWRSAVSWSCAVTVQGTWTDTERARCALDGLLRPIAGLKAAWREHWACISLL
jgi:hypothetical protein